MGNDLLAGHVINVLTKKSAKGVKKEKNLEKKCVGKVQVRLLLQIHSGSSAMAYLGLSSPWVLFFFSSTVCWLHHFIACGLSEALPKLVEKESFRKNLNHRYSTWEYLFHITSCPIKDNHCKLTLGGERAMWCIDDVLQTCMLDTYVVLLFIVAPINFN